MAYLGSERRTAAKGCGILAAVLIGLPLLIVGVVSVQTWIPLQEAGEAMEELDRVLGSQAEFIPPSSGAVAADRMEVFLAVRSKLAGACDEYGTVRKGFDSVESLDSRDQRDLGDVGGVAADLGAASLTITPFLARFFERRNDALLEVGMGLPEYSYIYAVAYREQLLSPRTRAEIFSDGGTVSPEGAGRLRESLAGQLEIAGDAARRSVLEAELEAMQGDPSRLLWRDGLPDELAESVRPYRARLDRLFCGATAGLEMDRSSRRALRIALE